MDLNESIEVGGGVAAPAVEPARGGPHDVNVTARVLPAGAPERWLDREVLWNEVEARETRQDAQLAREVEFPRGHAHNPMTDAEVEKKFRTMALARYGQERVERMLAACWELDKWDKVAKGIGLFDTSYGTT